ncbi:carbon-nitrogen hydrolase [Aspergillus similis]
MARNTFPDTPRPFSDPADEGQSPSYHALSALAAEAKAYLVGGSIPELETQSKNYYNTSLVFSFFSGVLIGTHRKTHPFGIDIPGKITFKESEVGCAIFYDTRVPEPAMMAARKGAFALIYPGAFNTITGPLHRQLLARARAVDNQIYTALCSPAGDVGATYQAYGHSLVADPSAKVLSEAEETENMIYADLDNETMKFRKRVFRFIRSGRSICIRM